MAQDSLQLRDVHLPPPPAWWPPAQGWWWVGSLLLLMLVALCAWLLWRRARQRRWRQLFDAECLSLPSATERVAAASALLRRAARRVDPSADRLQGDAWLVFLDGKSKKSHEFSKGAGRLLLDGGFRPQLADDEADAALALARRRFLQLMAGRR